MRIPSYLACVIITFLSSVALIDNHECMGREEEVSRVTEALSSQWEALLEHIQHKTQKLREANQQQQFNQVGTCVGAEDLRCTLPLCVLTGCE